jgi:molecular chaperone DnaK (HSP70)
VQPSHGLTEEEVERLVLESIDHAREDFNARRFIELKTKAEGDLRHTEKGLALEGANLSPEQRQRIDAAVAWTHQAMQGDSPDPLHEALDELNKATIPLAERLMNAVTNAALKDRKLEEISPKML